VLVSGATGYIGGRLVPCLLRSGYTVRCFVRDASRLQGYPWENDVEIAEGDALDYSTLPAVLDGVDAAYYLIHSLGAGEDEFEDLDRKAANNFGRAAQEAGVERIIYLGGIQPKGDAESDHLKSRLETGDYLRRWDVPVTELRAAVVVGSGSLSFELIRYLTERVPVMVCPTWVQTPTQPIAIRNVLQYLKAALETPESAGEIVEIGGTDVLTYGDMFKIYAEVRGLNRPIINVPVLTPRLSSHWVGLVTPVSNQIARPLIEGLDNEVTVDNPERARTLFPDVEPISYEAAVRLALRRTSSGDIPTVWNSALSSTPTAQSSTRPSTSTLDLTEGMFRETRQITVDAAPETAFDVVTRIGGANGWLYARPLWRLRGLVDQWIGGVGFRQGRRDPDDLRVGDTVDFWRVEALTDPRRDADADTFLLRLRAEMKMPGRAWLQYEVIPPEAQAAEASTNGQPAETCIAQTLFFEPKGLLGTLYWYAAQPVDRLIYSGMLRTLERRIRDAAPAHSAASERSPEPVA
jgi:uncharacterized protein YbjT (DUF2867 family)